jgi:large subunit ribosomal protein L5
MADLHKKYRDELATQLQKELNIANIMAVPQLQKIVLNMGVKDAVSDKKLIDRMVQAMAQISGQKPRIAKAKKSIATFKLREGDPIGVMVTLRGKRMYEFLDRLISIVLPRIKDFRGISSKSFDGRGNYALGFSEYSVFPEIDLGSVERMQGLEIIFVTSAKDDKDGFTLLKAFGMPFQKNPKS